MLDPAGAGRAEAKSTMRTSLARSCGSGTKWSGVADFDHDGAAPDAFSVPVPAAQASFGSHDEQVGQALDERVAVVAVVGRELQRPRERLERGREGAAATPVDPDDVSRRCRSLPGPGHGPGHWSSEWSAARSPPRTRSLLSWLTSQWTGSGLACSHRGRPPRSPPSSTSGRPGPADRGRAMVQIARRLLLPGIPEDRLAPGGAGALDHWGAVSDAHSAHATTATCSAAGREPAPSGASRGVVV